MHGQRYQRHTVTGGCDKRVGSRHAPARNVRLSVPVTMTGRPDALSLADRSPAEQGYGTPAITGPPAEATRPLFEYRTVDTLTRR